MVRFFIIFIILILLFAILIQLLSKYNLVSYKMRLGIGILLLVCGVGIGIFSFTQNKTETKLTHLAQAFLQGKNLQCKISNQEILVNKESFNFISGTLTLMGKVKSAYPRITIPLKACELE